MTGEPEQSRAVRAAENLTAELAGVRKDIGKLRTYGRLNRKLIILDITLTVVVATLSVLVGVFWFQLRTDHREAALAKAQAAQTAATSLRFCQLSNVARHQQLGLWEYVIHLNRHPTAAQRALDARFIAHLDVIFAARDCRQLPPAPKPSQRGGV
jgi:hypothetical protein